VALWKNVWKIIKNQNSFPADVLWKGNFYILHIKTVSFFPGWNSKFLQKLRFQDFIFWLLQIWISIFHFFATFLSGLGSIEQKAKPTCKLVEDSKVFNHWM
jgi:hypothetical protein